MKTSDFLYGLLSLKGVGNVKAAKISKAFTQYLRWNDYIPDDIITSELGVLFPQEVVSEFIQKQWLFQTRPDYPIVKYINYCQDVFPQTLHSLGSDCPLQLACLGNLDLLNDPSVGFCGSREASEKGLRVTNDIVQQLVEKGIVVVSGYASGIDIQAHHEALKAGGKTIIVLPEGIGFFMVKQALIDVWDWERALVISEFTPDAIWSAYRAMHRNGIIVGLSRAMFLIEAKENGGSFDAGLKTFKLNKVLYVPVYESMPDFAKGNSILLSKGAYPIRKKKETGKANLDEVFAFLKSSIMTDALLSF